MDSQKLVVIENFDVTQFRRKNELFYKATVSAALMNGKVKIEINSDEVQADEMSVDIGGKLGFRSNGMTKAIVNAYEKIKTEYGVKEIDFDKSTPALDYFKSAL